MKIKTLMIVAGLALSSATYALTPSQEASQEALAAANDARVAAQSEHPTHRPYRVISKQPLQVEGNPVTYIQSLTPLGSGQSAPVIESGRYFGQVVKNDLVDSMNADPDSIQLKRIYVTPQGYGYRFEIAQVSCDYREIRVNPKTHGITEYYADCDIQ